MILWNLDTGAVLWLLGMSDFSGRASRAQFRGRKPNTSRPASMHVDDYQKQDPDKMLPHEKVALMEANQKDRSRFPHPSAPGLTRDHFSPPSAAPPAQANIGQQLLLTLQRIITPQHHPGINVKALVADPGALKIFLSQHPSIHAQLCQQLEQTKSQARA